MLLDKKLKMKKVEIENRGIETRLISLSLLNNNSPKSFDIMNLEQR